MNVDAEAHGSATNGFPPPKTNNLPNEIALPGTFVSAGSGASTLQLIEPMWYAQASLMTWFSASRPPAT